MAKKVGYAHASPTYNFGIKKRSVSVTRHMEMAKKVGYAHANPTCDFCDFRRVDKPRERMDI